MDILLYLFIVCALYQIAYQAILLIAILKNKSSPQEKSNKSKSVSIIICAKNEAENLHKNLPFILTQNYPDFEVIIVDDGSDERLTINDKRLTIITLPKEEKIGLGKKYALQKGIEAAKKELILLTDADCRPISPRNWISEMANCVNDRHKIVLGISPYKKEITFLNGLIEYETAQTALQYLGFALLGKPYMAVGRNVLYDAALLKSKTWTDEELSIASGDDDLAIQKLATKENTAVCLSKGSYTISEAKKNWKEWIQQKLRHYESGHLYKPSHRLLLGSYLFSKLYLYFSILFVGHYFYPFILLYFILITVINLLLHRKLQLNHRWNLAFLNDILYCIFTILLGIISTFKPVKNWK